MIHSAALRFDWIYDEHASTIKSLIGHSFEEKAAFINWLSCEYEACSKLRTYLELHQGYLPRVLELELEQKEAMLNALT